MNKGKGKRELPDSSSDGIAAKLLKMQQKIRKTRADLAEETVTATIADGAVAVVVSGDQRVQEIRIAPELLEHGDSSDLANILVPAINDAIEKSQTLAARRLQHLTGMLGLSDQ